MALQLFSTGDHDNPGFVEKVEQYVFPDLAPSNAAFPIARFIQNGLIAAQTFVECLRSNNVNFYDRDDVTVSCKVATLTGPNRARIQSVYAFKPSQKCKRVHYEQKGVGAIWCYANSHGCCVVSESAADIVFQSVMTGAAFCDQDDLVITESGFLCSERIWARGTCDRIYLASMFPCDYKVAVHWEGIKQHYADTDLITDDEELLDVIALYLEGERALRLDRDMDKHKQLMRKPEGRGDWGGVFWQRLMDMKHRCREERRLRKDYLCDAIFDDNALVDACALTAGGVVVPEPDGCGVNQYELDGECVDCETPAVTISASDESINLGESVTLSWASIVPDIASSVVTVEYGSTITVVTRNAAGELVVSPTEDTTYTIRAVTVCGNATFSATVVVTEVPPCVCPEGMPDCLQLSGYDPDEVFFPDCVSAGVDGGDTLWNGQLPRISDCRWGYEFPNDLYYKGGVGTNSSLSVIVELISCDPYTYRLSFYVWGGDAALLIWQGETQGLPLGVYTASPVADTCSQDGVPLTLEACEECTKPTIRFDPPSGSTVNFPTLVFIHASISGSAIYYGIDEEPIHLYTGPLSLSAGQVLKARAFVNHCVGDAATATYTSDTGLEFAFICDPPQDKAGVFGEFAPNGDDNDYHWRLKLTRSVAWTFRNAKIYETDAQGVWVTGQAWATENPIYPIEMTPNPFSVYPLVFFNTTPAQINSAYGDPVASFGAGLTELHAYGQPAVPLTGYFRLEFTLDEGGAPFTIYKLIPHFCAPPPPCPIPSLLLATADCTGAITLNGNTDIGFTYRLYKATMPSCGTGIHTVVEEFIAIEDDFVRNLSGTNDCSYSYFLSVYCAATDGWVDAAPVVVAVPPACEVETEFCNHTPIIINAFGTATPYPSTITVAGRPGNVVKATVYLYNYFHRYPDDVEILLVGPDGTAVLLMNDVGGFGPNQILTPGINLTLDDAATGYMPDQTKLLAGTYKPTAYGPDYIPSALPTHSDGTFLPSPAPAGPYNQTLAAFIGKPCNGAWMLLVNDDQGQDGGAINGGWCLQLDES